MKIQILIFNGFDELDAIAPFEVFQSAAAMGIDVRAEFVTRLGRLIMKKALDMACSDRSIIIRIASNT
jgi:putative intracellular protease/amidase